MKKCIYVIIDKVKGVLKILVDNEGYEIFVVLDDVGGCFFVLIVVGLFLIVVSGVDIDVFMNGVVVVSKDFDKFELKNNIVY